MKIKVTCTGRGPNSCFGYSAVQNSSGCHQPNPPFNFPVNPCEIEQIVIGEIDAGFAEKKGIYNGNIYWRYVEGEFDPVETTYSYDLLISDQPLW